MKQFAFVSLLMIAFASCKNQPLPVPDEVYLKQGDSLSASTFDTLRTSLLKAIKENGIAAAVTYCQVQAMPLTQAYAGMGIRIARVAEKYRNPLNQPDSTDTNQWNQYVQQKANGDSLHATLVMQDGRVIYYKPIVMLPLCVTCHSSKEMGMQEDVLATIDSLYPQDKAMGFANGDLRGMWKITMPKK